MGTIPNNYPPENNIPIGGIQTGNALGLTAALTTTVFFTAPTAGWYMLSWACRINSTDAAGSLTVTVKPPHNAAIPGVNAAPATPTNGQGPAVPCWMAGGETVTGAVAVSGLTGTNYDLWVFAQRLA